jgi:hypothetical protein
LFLARVVERILKSAPADADLMNWRYYWADMLPVGSQ